MFSILNPPPSSLPTPSPWVVPVHQPQASSIVHQTWTGNSFHTWYYTCFNAILPNLIVEVYVPDIRIGFFGCKLIYLYKVVPIDIFFKLKYVFACFFGLACSVNINSCIQFDAWYRMLGAGARGWPRGMVWGGMWEGGSGWGTRVHPWWIHVDVW